MGEPASPASDPGYLLDNRAPEAGQRFDSLSALFNPVTFRHFEMLGISEGWRCWEVGVGGPSIPRWLSERVGSSGRVIATDIDVRWVQRPVADTVEVLRSDVATDDPPPGPFDVIHERLVLIHLPRRREALERMIGALRPGGWLLLEDYDPNLQPFACPDAQGPVQQLANKMRAGFRALLAEPGADLQLGRQLPRLLRDAGLSTWRPTPICRSRCLPPCRWRKRTFTRFAKALLPGGTPRPRSWIRISRHWLRVRSMWQRRRLSPRGGAPENPSRRRRVRNAPRSLPGHDDTAGAAAVA